MLKLNQKLLFLDLFQNDLGKDLKNFEILADGIAKNKSLRGVDLGKNNFVGIECVKILAVIIENNNTLEEIDIHKNEICWEGFSFLIEALKKNMTLKIINLKSNSFNQKGNEEKIIEKLKEVEKINPGLKIKI